MKRSYDWLSRQLLTIGSSAAGVVAGESPYSTPFELYTAMVDAVAGCITAKDMNDDMRRGILTEPLHRELLAEKLGMEVDDHNQEEFLYNAKFPWAHALPDGWVAEGADWHEAFSIHRIPVQLKCPRVRSWYELKLKGIHGHWLLGSQHALAVTGAPYEHFSVLNPESMQLLTFVVERDEAIIDSLMNMEKKFYERFLERLPPEDTRVRIELPPLTGDLVEIYSKDAEAAAASYLDAKEMLEEAEALCDISAARLKEIMGSARVADMPGLRAYRSNQKGRPTYDYKAMGADGIDVEKYSKRGDDFETFRVFKRG